MNQDRSGPYDDVRTSDKVRSDPALDQPPLRSQLVWIALLISLYVVVSLIGWHRTLIHDEIWYLLNAGKPLSVQLNTLRVDITQPPLMYLLERVWMQAFGQTDDAIKLLVLAINALGIALFSAFAALVIRRWRLASFLLCTAYLQVGGVPNLARSYSLGLLLTIASLLAWEFWRRRPTIGRLVLWSFVMVLLAYTHYVCLLLLVPFVLVNWIYGHRPWLFAAVAALVGVSFLPWFVAVLPVYLSQGLDQQIGWVEKNPFLILAKLPFYFLTYLPSGWNPYGANDWPQSIPLRNLLICAALAAHGSLLVLALRRWPDFWPPQSRQAAAVPWFWSAALLGGFPILTLLLFSLTIHPALDARFVAFVLPMYWLLVAMLADWGGRLAPMIVYAVFVPWLFTSITIPLVRNAGGPALHRSLAVVAQQIQPGDLIVCERLAGPQVYWEWTRSFQHPEPVVIASNQPSPPDASILPVRKVNEIDVGKVTRVWFFATTYNPGGAADIRDFLTDHGFHRHGGPSSELPFLTLFEKTS